MNVIMVRLGEDNKDKILSSTASDDAGEKALRFLRVLLSGKLEADARLKIFEKEYGIDPVAKDYGDLTKEVNDMCNISDGIYNDGYSTGVIQGEENGMMKTISILKGYGISKESIIAKLTEEYDIAKSKAETYVNIVWQTNA